MREQPYLRLVPLEEEEEPAEIGVECTAKDLAIISAALCAAAAAFWWVWRKLTRGQIFAGPHGDGRTMQV